MDATPESLRSFFARDQLRNGRELLIRAINPQDKDVLQEGLHRLSAESSYCRFFHYKNDLTLQELKDFTEPDFDRHVALVAVDEDLELVVGVTRYFFCDELPVRTAEITLAVEDEYHGLGVGSLLLGHLVDIGRAAGYREFRAAVLGENYKMLDVLYNMNLPLRRSMEGNTVEVHLSLDQPPVI